MSLGSGSRKGSVEVWSNVREARTRMMLIVSQKGEALGLRPVLGAEPVLRVASSPGLMVALGLPGILSLPFDENKKLHDQHIMQPLLNCHKP